jgi:uncharacterized protein YjbJ (UPF0337 family)
MNDLNQTMEDKPMDQDIFAGQWKQMRGTLKLWWGKLTDDDFERIGGQKDKLIGWVQEHYGQTREQAQHEVERHMKEYGDTKGDRVGYGMSDATEAVAGMAAKTQELGTAAIMGTASGAATAATTIAGGLESASTYLKEKDYKNLATDLTALVRSYPVQALLVGVGLGYLLARSTKG